MTDELITYCHEQTMAAVMQGKFDAEPEIKSWHNGYRAACKDICERFGLDNTDEIELLVKERDALKANNEWMDKEFVRLNQELQKAEHADDTYAKSNDDYRQELFAAQKDQELFRVFAVDVNNLREQVLIKDGEIERLKSRIDELHNVLDDFKALRRLMDATKIGRKQPL